jgi:Na+/H+ antiporter NhaD/arsenite permease-like protein
MLAVVTAAFSAFLDNVTTVLLIAPITLLITEELDVNPYPYCSQRSLRQTMVVPLP